MTGADRAVRAAASGSVPTAMASTAHRSERCNPSASPAAASALSRGRTAVWIGWATIPYGARNTHHGELVGDHAAGHTAADDEGGGEQDAGAGVLQRGPARTGGAATARPGRSTAADDARRKRNPERRQPDGGHAHEGGHAERAAEGEAQLLARREVEAGVGSGHQRGTGSWRRRRRSCCRWVRWPARANRPRACSTAVATAPMA